MNRFLTTLVLTSFIFLSMASSYAQVKSADWQLEFGPEGTLSHLRADTTDFLTAATVNAPIRITDVQSGQTAVASTAFEHTEQEWHQDATLAALQLQVETNIRPDASGALLVEGRVHDLSGQDRALDIELRLPLTGDDWRWRNDFGQARFGSPDEDLEATQITGAVSIENEERAFPLAAVTNKAEHRGLAVGIPPQSPSLFVLSYKPGAGLSAIVQRGITGAGRGALKSQTSFSFALFAVNSEWGERDALRQYYQLAPELFTPRTTARGLWRWSSGRGGAAPNSADYAFHEITDDRGAVDDERLGLLSFPYIIVGQREVTGFKVEPKTDAEKLALLSEIPPTNKNAWWGKDVGALVENSGLQTADGSLNGYTRRPKWVVRPGQTEADWPLRLTFPINPNPALWEDEKKPTVGSTTLAWVEQMLAQRPEVDGIYVDSLNLWGRYLNFRRDHFAYASIAPTFDPKTKKVALANQFSHLEFLRELSTRLHAKEKLLWGNGAVPQRAFLAFQLDVLGSENAVSLLTADNLARLRAFRALAGNKPYLLMNNHEADWSDPQTVATYWKSAALYGLYPAFHNSTQTDAAILATHKAIIDKYLPLIRACNAAGWQPVTGVSTDAGILVERFGPDAQGRTFLTVYNPTATAHKTTVITEPRWLGAPVATADEELSGRALNPANLQIDIAPDDLRVIRLQLAPTSSKRNG